MMRGSERCRIGGGLGLVFECCQFDFDSKSVLIRTLFNFSLIHTLSTLLLM